MTRDRYLMMCEQLGKDPDPEEMPPDYSDFPDVAIHAMNIFSMLNDRMYPDIGYVGKDYTNLPVLMQIYNIHKLSKFTKIIRIFS